MNRTLKSYVYEARSMVQFILEGNNEKETAEEFNVSHEIVRRRIKLLGYTYEDLVECKNKNSSKKIQRE